MLRKIVYGDFVKIPEEYQKKFLEEQASINFSRSRNFTIVLSLLVIILFYIDLINRRNGLWVNSGYKMLLFIHLLLWIGSLLLLIMGSLKKTIVIGNYQWKKVYSLLFVSFILIISAGISAIDQLLHGQITVFLLGALAIAGIHYLAPVTSFLMYLSSYAVFIIGVSTFQANVEVLSANIINGTILILIAWTLSIILYNKKVKDFLSRQTIERQKAELEEANAELKLTNQQLQESCNALDESQNMIFSLTVALESKDLYTRGHSERVAEYAQQLAGYLNLPELEQVTLWRAAILHDIGKIGIPDAILNKVGPLTKEEWVIIRSHPERGENICDRLNFARDTLPIIRHHHERYDGKGYPDGLKGQEIPYLARIIAIADTVDAITSNRSYRSAQDWQVALSELEAGAGSQYDPELARAFIELYKTSKLNKELETITNLPLVSELQSL